MFFEVSTVYSGYKKINYPATGYYLVCFSILDSHKNMNLVQIVEF